MSPFHKTASSKKAFPAIALAVAVALTLGQSAHAANKTWKTTGNLTTDWATPANWNSGVATGDAIIFGLNGSASVNSNNTLTNTLTSSSFVIKAITFSSTAAAYTMGGEYLHLGQRGGDEFHEQRRRSPDLQ